ncbi:hypothetical protein WBG78_22000 [Chryseolinea sp. T2]|uniref:hypothetical protein n=1 Tax=Chryseolinea sp. T2 TaxID=3129255 RepID=UPI0030773C5E
MINSLAPFLVAAAISVTTVAEVAILPPNSSSTPTTVSNAPTTESLAVEHNGKKPGKSSKKYKKKMSKQMKKRKHH